MQHNRKNACQHHCLPETWATMLAWYSNQTNYTYMFEKKNLQQQVVTKHTTSPSSTSQRGWQSVGRFRKQETEHALRINWWNIPLRSFVMLATNPLLDRLFYILKKYTSWWLKVWTQCWALLRGYWWVKSSKSGNAVGCFVAQVRRSVKQTFLSCCRLSSCVASFLRQISSYQG